MNNGQFSGEHIEIIEEEEGRLSLNDLPDELLLLIFNRLLDLKCLCLCSLVSPRFSSLVFQIHSVTFDVVGFPTDDLIPTPPATDSLITKTFRFFNGIVAKPLHYFRQFLAPQPLSSMIRALYFMKKINSIRSLHLVLPSAFSHSQNPNVNDDSLYKWAAKLGPTVDTIVFLCTSSIRVGGEIDFDEQEQQEDPLSTNESRMHRVHLALNCMKDAIVWNRVLRNFIKHNPLLQNITITDSEKHGCLSLRDSKLVEVRNWLNSASKTELNRVEFTVNFHRLHMPVLKLPVSSKVMVSPSLVVMEMVDRRHERRDWGVDAAEIATLFSQQGEDEFAEAVVEMMVNHNSRMETIYTRGG